MVNNKSKFKNINKNIKTQKTEDEQQLNTSTIEGYHRYSGCANDFNLNCHDNPNQSIMIVCLKRLIIRSSPLCGKLRQGAQAMSSSPVFRFVLLDLQLDVYVLQIVVCPFVLFFFWPLCFLFFFDIWILITPLLFANSFILKN